MKRIVATALFAVSSLAIAGNAFAQDVKLRANIPFAFTLNNKVLPAGTYTVSPGLSRTVVLQNDETNIAAISSAYTSGKQAADPVLIFHRYGNKYFLAEILDSSRMSLNVDIPRSKLERNARLEEASLASQTKVLIALK